MKAFLRASVGTLSLLAATSAWAECGIDKGSVRILSNDFESLHIIATEAAKCASPTVTVTANQTAEHKNIQVPALTSNPSTYTVAMIANNSIVPLLSDDLIRPLDDYVAKWGQDLDPNQLIKVDGKVMAIVFQINAQHMLYRKDLLEKAGVAVPKSYEDVIAAAQVLRDQKVIDTPLLGDYKPGWDLAAQFVDLYLGMGGDFFEPGSSKLAIDNDKSLKVLETMKAVSGYMSPDFVTYDSNGAAPVWRGGQAAIQVDAWGSRMSGLVDPNNAAPGVAENSAVGPAPTIGGGTVPAAAIWWDGFTIAKNIPDEDAEASFRAMVYGIRPQVAQDNADVTAWLVKGYQPTPLAAGVFETLKAGARPYPMVPTMGLLHTALGNELGEFIQGREDAPKALADVIQAYDTAAREGGFLN